MKNRWLPILLAMTLLMTHMSCLAELPQTEYNPPEPTQRPKVDYSGWQPSYMIEGINQVEDPLDCFPNSMPGALVLTDGTTIDVPGAITEDDDEPYDGGDTAYDDANDDPPLENDSPQQANQDGSSPTALASDSGARRTVMVYMIGSNLESEHGFASMDLAEIMNCHPDLNLLNVVVATGGARSWNDLSLSDGQMQVTKLKRDASWKDGERLDSPAVRDMADPATLSYFVRLAMSACPAERYDLILWNHGGGPLVGYGYDECADNILPLWSIANALSDAGLGPMRRLEMIGFDACLMGSVEVAAMMAPYAKYLVASEEVLIGTGWDYSFLGSSAIIGTDAEAILRDLCTRFESGMQRYSNVDYTLSAIHLDDVAAVGNSMDSLFYRDAEFQPRDVGAVASCVDRSCAFSRFNSTQHYDLFDLKDFAQQATSILPRTSAALSRAVDGCVVCNVSNMPGASGLSFYFPMDDPQYAPVYLDRVSAHLTDMGFASGYATFLKTTLSGDSIGASSIAPTLQGQANPGDPVYKLKLTPEQHARFARGIYVVLARLKGEDAYRLVEASRNVFLDQDGTLWTAREKAFYCLGGWQEDVWCEGPMISSSMRDGIERFQVNLVLMRMPSGIENMKYWRTGNMSLQLEVDHRSETGRVYRMVPQTDTGLPSRELLEIQYDDIMSASYQAMRPRYDASGNLMAYTDWERYYPNGYYGWECRVGSSGLLVDYRPGDPNTEYFIQLIALDVNGQATGSPLMPMR